MRREGDMGTGVWQGHAWSTLSTQENRKGEYNDEKGWKTGTVGDFLNDKIKRKGECYGEGRKMGTVGYFINNKAMRKGECYDEKGTGHWGMV